MYNSRKMGEAGFAAIVIAIVLVIILSLTTVGFASLMRTETNSTTTNHLSSQAYYAAESGINDAAVALTKHLITTKKTDCTHADWEVGTGTAKGQVGADPNIGYTCVLVDPTPTMLNYSSINTDQGNVIKLSGADISSSAATEIHSLRISWQAVGTSGTTFRNDSSHHFPNTDEWSNSSSIGMLRIALTPLTTGSLNEDYMIANTYTAYAYPNANGTSTGQYGDGIGKKAGQILDGKCSQSQGPLYCSVLITNLGFTKDYILNVRSIYRPSRLAIEAFSDDTGTSKIGIANAQTVIDSTGRAQDTLRRIRVSVPSENHYDVPNYPVEVSGSLCKQLELLPDAGYVSASDSKNLCNPADNH